jgi:hypothetical protein
VTIAPRRILDIRTGCREAKLVIASQRVRPEVAGPMTSSAKQSRRHWKNWIASSLALLAMTTLQN